MHVKTPARNVVEVRSAQCPGVIGGGLEASNSGHAHGDFRLQGALPQRPFARCAVLKQVTLAHAVSDDLSLSYQNQMLHYINLLFVSAVLSLVHEDLLATLETKNELHNNGV
jgi:hypothetical protein